MTSPWQLILTAVAALSVGAAGTYATVHVTAVCQTMPAVVGDDGLPAFLAKPNAPLTGYPEYK